MANHYFYAVLLPEAFKQKLQQATAGLKGSLPFKRWVHRDDLHITLAFLGAAEEAQLEKANRLIADQIGAFHVLPLVFDHFGTFGKKDEPRVLFAGIQESPPLSDLETMVAGCCLEAGFSLDRRPFHPHMTLARKWDGDRPFADGMLDAFSPEPVPFSADRIVLYRTNLHQTPKYEIVQSFRLADAQNLK
ncbi:RNA 2',3'-cyclic phosphodiesterase [Weizmannia coagulans]|jgi:2'-5' RNA ligase|uniref:RNA 2',3'-cyclic phosphodiesterase n=3 Tax=Heyndrickxia TaxID=2837504 RepID=G2TNA5_HEYCO|nr:MULTISPECIES: RNA 2',3'-cyclic phosphodiesterase [Heyndrickxia]AEP01614.1 2'-5' RNA ligase [Heyndrickxia coagulans 36D1]AJO22169.1 2-5 RNA ligase [Heyndrickxia coagulans]AKN56293.1 2'-5' RNA ligase [Heyndrickxia coagulans]APB36776.1 2'-5' RNA ligase [Heyndrickxia coagulans]ATW82551.1 RNA 2',3'-cyclic phosphodiesterase [Heyndrickxia coagulans]